MGESVEKEFVVPSGMEHLVADALRPGSCLEDVDGDLSEGSEVLGGMIFAGSAGILAEQDVEYPVEIVLDAPMGANDLEELLGGKFAREQEEADLGLGRLGVCVTPTVDAADGNEIGGALGL